MPQINSFQVQDSATVLHTFTSIGKDAKGVLFFEETTPTPANNLGAIRFGFKLDRPVAGGSKKGQLTGDATVTVSLLRPTLETLGSSDSGIPPPPTIAYRDAGRMSFSISERSTQTERNVLSSLMAGVLYNSDVNNAITKLIPLL